MGTTMSSFPVLLKKVYDNNPMLCVGLKQDPNHSINNQYKQVNYKTSINTNRKPKTQENSELERVTPLTSHKTLIKADANKKHFQNIAQVLKHHKLRMSSRHSSENDYHVWVESKV